MAAYTGTTALCIGEEKVELLLAPTTGAEEERPKWDHAVFPSTGQMERLEAF